MAVNTRPNELCLMRPVGIPLAPSVLREYTEVRSGLAKTLPEITELSQFTPRGTSQCFAIGNGMSPYFARRLANNGG